MFHMRRVVLDIRAMCVRASLQIGYTYAANLLLRHLGSGHGLTDDIFGGLAGIVPHVGDPDRRPRAASSRGGRSRARE